MTPTKLARSAALMYDCRQDTSLLTVGALTLDALTVYQSPTKALELANWWQRIREIEVQYEHGFTGYTGQGDDIRELAWELHGGCFIPMVPQFGYNGEDETNVEYDDELLMMAMVQLRRAILDAIYVEVEDV